MRDAQGRFLPGPDPARHRLTKKERRKGYATALTRMQEDWQTWAWLYRRIRGWYRQQKK